MGFFVLKLSENSCLRCKIEFLERRISRKNVISHVLISFQRKIGMLISRFYTSVPSWEQITHHLITSNILSVVSDVWSSHIASSAIYSYERVEVREECHSTRISAWNSATSDDLWTAFKWTILQTWLMICDVSMCLRYLSSIHRQTNVCAAQELELYTIPPALNTEFNSWERIRKFSWKYSVVCYFDTSFLIASHHWELS